MTCPFCRSFELDVTAHCDGCGQQLSVADELKLRASMPPPRTKAIEDDRFDLAQREGG